MELVVPSINKFGSGVIQEIGPMVQELKLKHALIVTDINLNKLGIVKFVTDQLDLVDVTYSIYDAVQPNPTVKNVEDAVEVYHDNKCDFIIGIGGGSPNDCSKAVGIVVSNGGKIHDYEGFNQSKQQAPITMLVNTTAGTASEISRAYLISDDQRVEKLIFKDINALPYCSFNDPDMMLGLPASITAGTGMDALTHAIESYVSVGAYELTRKLSQSAIELVFDNLEKVIENPRSVEYRENMIYAQTLAGMAFCNAGLGLVHSMAHQLGAVYNLPHGLCNAIILPEVMKYNQQVVGSRYADLAKVLFLDEVKNMTEKEQSQYFIDQVETLSTNIGTKIKLRDLGVVEEDIEMLAEKSLVDGNLPRNPIQPSKEDVIQLFRNLV